jgi:hypothetical protein
LLIELSAGKFDLLLIIQTVFIKNRNMRTVILLTFVFAFFTPAFSQNVGIGTNQPHATAALDIQSNSKGLLIPRMTSTQRNNIAAPATGLLVYDTDKGTIYMFDGVQWQSMNFSGNTPYATSVTSNAPVVNEGFGYAVSLSGNYAAISAFKLQQGSGSVYVFIKSGGSWIFQAKLVQSNPAANDMYGRSVAISNDQILVGAPWRNNKRGAVYAYSRSGDVWTQTAIITTPDQQVGSLFGSTISMNGQYAMINAPNFSTAQNSFCGTVYCYFRNGAGWQHTQQLYGITTLMQQEFGASIDISGTYAIIGAPDASYGGINNRGIAYLFKRTGTVWSPLDTIYSEGSFWYPDNFDQFGKSVAVYELNTTVWAFISRPGYDVDEKRRGEVIGFVLGPTGLDLTTTIFPPGGQYSVYQEHNFGESISLYDGYLVIGSPEIYNEDAAEGKVYVYKYDASFPEPSQRWRPWKTIKDNGIYQSRNAYDVDKIGRSIFINGFDIIIGNSGANEGTGKVLFLNVE